MPDAEFDLNLSESLKPYKSAVILHIPHSKIFIPEYGSYFDANVARKESILHCDTDTDYIFDIEGVERLVFPYSRVYVDVERFVDDREPMNSIGRGFYYLNDSKGNPFRGPEDAPNALNAYVLHHAKLHNMVDEILQKENEALIIDCHAFDEHSLGLNDKALVDVCIGTDPYHTPVYVTEKLVSYFRSQGYSVDVDKPFSGTIVPERFYQKDKRVQSVMIELNKNLYRGEQLYKWRELIRGAIKQLYRE